jgi:O-antigen/teichoic acid export membrane protein
MSVRRSMAWSLFGNWVNFASTLLAGMVLARLLSPAEFGVFTVAMAIVGIIQALLQMGPASVLIREPEIDRDIIGSALSVALIEGLAVSIMVAGSSSLVAAWQRSEEAGWILLVLAPMPLFTAIENLLMALWSRDMQFGRTAGLITAKSACQGVTSVGLAFAGLGPVSLAAGTVAAASLGLLVGIVGLRGRRATPNLRHFRRFATFGGKWMVLGGLRAVNVRLPELMLGRLVGLASAGLYNRASSSLDMVIRNGIEPIARVMLPVLAEDRRRGEGMANGVIKLSANLTAIFWPLLGFLALESSSAILILFGEKWMSAAPVLSLLCVWAALMLPTSGTAEVLLILDRMGLALRIEAARTVIGILLVVAAAPAGLFAVAAVRILEPLFVMPFYTLVLRRLAGMSIRRWAAAQGQSLLITILTLVPLVLMQDILRPTGAVFLDLAFRGMIATILFVGALLVLRHPLATDAFQIMHRRLGWGA